MSPAIDVPSIMVCRPCLNRARSLGSCSRAGRMFAPPCLIPGTTRHQPDTAEGERLKWTSSANQSGSACLLEFQARSDFQTLPTAQFTVGATVGELLAGCGHHTAVFNKRGGSVREFRMSACRRDCPMPTRIAVFFTSVGWAAVAVAIPLFLIFGPG